MQIPSVGQIFVIWFYTLIGLAIANYLFLLLAYDWRTYVVLGTFSFLAYLVSGGSLRRSGRNSHRGSRERTPYSPMLSRRMQRSRHDWEG